MNSSNDTRADEVSAAIGRANESLHDADLPTYSELLKALGDCQPGFACLWTATGTRCWMRWRSRRHEPCFLVPGVPHERNQSLPRHQVEVARQRQ